MGKHTGTARGMYEAFGRGDVDAVLAAMDDDVEWVYPEGGLYDTQVGPHAVAENVFAPVMQDFSDFTVTVDEYVEGGDVVCTIGRYGGTAVETGKVFDNDFVHVLRFGENGKLVRYQEYTDTHVARQVRGH